jgi:uncharacterized protein
MLRLSSYSILSDQLSNGDHALANGCTGAIDLVSSKLACIINDLKSKKQLHSIIIPDNLIQEDIVKEFISRGHFTKVSHEMERDHVIRIADLQHAVVQVNPHFLIIPSLDCNYRCTYCYERPLQNKFDSQVAKEMNPHGNNVILSDDQITAAYAGISRIQSSAKKLSIWDDIREAGLCDDQQGSGQIILFGGEPLNADHQDLVFKIVHQGLDRGYKFAAVTNGHDLNHFLPLLGENKIEQLQITFDGPKHIHNKKRVSRDRKSSFDKITSNIRRVLSLEHPPEIQIRVHMYPSTIELFGDLLAFFCDEGWLNHEDVVIYMSNIFLKDKDGKVSGNINYKDIFKSWLDIIAPYRNIFISGVSVHSHNLLSPVLEAGDPLKLKGTYCGANSGEYIFSPDGYIYACWESLGKGCSRIGSYSGDQGLVLDPKMTGKWFNRSVSKIKECTECPYCLICGGGCAQYAQYNHGTLLKPFCDNFQEIYPAAFAKTVEDHLIRKQKIYSDKVPKRVLHT